MYYSRKYQLTTSEVFFVQNGWIQGGRIKDGWSSSWVRMNWFESEFCVKWLNPRWQNSRWQNSRWLPSSTESVWIRLSQSQSGVRVEWEWFWVNMGEDNKVSESKMAKAESKMAEFKMTDIIKLSEEWVNLSQIELVWFRVLCRMAESKMEKFKMAEFKMAAIIKLRENEWVWVRLNLFESESEWSESVFEWNWEKITRCLNPRWQNSRWLQSSSWVRMNEWSFLCKWWGGKCEWSFFCSNGGNQSWQVWGWEEILRWLNPRWHNSRWLPSSS